MERIYDVAQIEQWVTEQKIRDFFDTKDLVFHAYRYEKGEYLTSPNKRLEELLFVVRGAIQIYGVRDDGGVAPVNQTDRPTVIGDLEFSTQGDTLFFVETQTPVICVALPVGKYRKQLNSDLRFLHFLLQSYAEKIQLFGFDLAASTIEERVLAYMKKNQPHHELKGISTAVLQLRCSRRQLQRVLKKLCETGQVEKLEKGRYRLAL